MSGGPIIVTGGAGFIGSGLVASLNEAGEKNLWVVDEHFDDPLKRANLEGKFVEKEIDKDAFLETAREQGLPPGCRGVLHMGACSSTTETDEAYLERNNVEYSKVLCRAALGAGARFIYASSAATYGGGERGYRDDPAGFDRLKPLNAYGRSKLRFDQWVRDQGLMDKVAGFKFFNVFGPNEQHKGFMRSVAAKAFEQIRENGRLELFKSAKPGVGDGEQDRDFVYVKDAVKIVLEVFRRPEINGIFNLGTGKARTWLDLGRAVFAALGKEPDIRFIDMPEELRGKYQYHTQADMARLASATGYLHFSSLEESVRDYVQGHLLPGKAW